MRVYTQKSPVLSCVHIIVVIRMRTHVSNTRAHTHTHTQWRYYSTAHVNAYVPFSPGNFLVSNMPSDMTYYPYAVHTIQFVPETALLFSMWKLTKFPLPYGGGFTFYYTSHVTKRCFPHVHRARPLTGLGNGSSLAENRIEYVLLTT